MTVPKDIISVVSSSPSPTSLSGATSFSQSHSNNTTTTNGSYFPTASAKQLRPFATEDIKVLLLENVNRSAREILEREGYQVEFHESSLEESDLIEKIRDVHVIGIRSKTKLTSSILGHAKNLLAVGCFCIGTDQVDLDRAAERGVPVFNSPFSNSRSVAEMVIAEIIMLARQVGDRSMEMSSGTWKKVSVGCWEVRGKTLGIVGYGHVGSQLSVLAEAMGMNVIFYDVVPLMAMGKARQVKALPELLSLSDFVSLHVPESPETRDMMGPEELKLMKRESYLINASRGSVVNLGSLINALQSNHLSGAALDVFPREPKSNGGNFTADIGPWASDLRNLPNVILTPHIGGSTEEAQEAIGTEVGSALVRYVNCGTTTGAVNMPEVTLRSLALGEENHLRVIFIHQNRPGVLGQVNDILGDHNVDKQMSDSRGDVAYMMADISDVGKGEIAELYSKLEVLSSKIKTRMLY